MKKRAALVCEFTTWTASEAAEATGVNTTAQRDWRRRGFLRVFKGQARYHALDLAELWILRLLSERGIPLKDARPMVQWIAVGVVSSALRWVDAYRSEHLDIFRRRWRESANFFAGHLLAAWGRPPAAPKRFFIWWADGSHKWEHSLDAAFDAHLSSDPHVAGPVVVLDTHGLGSEFLERVKRPLAHIRVNKKGKKSTTTA